MFRQEALWAIPAIILALFQTKFIWGRLLPVHKEEETKIRGKYSDKDKLLFSLLEYLCIVILWIQLSWAIFPISDSSATKIALLFLGYSLVVSGFAISLAALKALGENWTGMYWYRIKKNQKLVTSGIYKYVRHPIYLAVIIEIGGYEIIMNSWLFLPFILILFIFFYIHIVKEEALLEEAFGQKFLNYKKKTRIFIPRII